MDIKALWQKLTADKVLSESDLKELEQAGMKREEALEKARNEDLTYRISGNKAAEEGVGDMVHISASFGGKKVSADVALNAEGRIDPNTEEGKAALEAAGFTSVGVVGNKFIGVKADGTTEVLRDYAELAQDMADENEKVQLAKEIKANEGIMNSMDIVLTPLKVLGLFHSCKDGSDDPAPKDFNITQLGIQININDTGSIVDAIKQFKDLYEKISKDNNVLLGDIKGIIDGWQQKYEKECEKNDAFRKRLIELMEETLKAIQNLPVEFRPYFESLLNAVNGNGKKLSQIIALMKTLNANVNAINSTIKGATQRVLMAIQKLNCNMVGGMHAILMAIIKNGNKLGNIEAALGRIEAMLNKLNSLVVKYGDKGEEIGNAILTAIGNLDFSHDVDLSKIEALLEKLVNGQVTIIEKLDVNAPDYSDQLQTIITLLSKFPSTDLSKIEKLLETAVVGIQDNGDLLRKITQQNDIVIEILKNFRQEVGTQMKGIDKWLELIYKKIPAGGQGGCNIDFNALMAKLQEILEAIKDHDVVVTVDVTGHCCCTKDGEEVHEGVLGNLDGILG